MELWKSKESFMEKVNSNNTWKMLLDWSLFFKIIIRISKKKLSYVENFQIYTQKMSVHFLYFYLNKDELIQQVCLRKYIENEIFNSTSH